MAKGLVKFTHLLRKLTTVGASKTYSNSGATIEEVGFPVECKPLVWEWISTTFFRENSDARFWWRTAGYMLAILLRQADYSVESQYRHLILFALLVAPELGAPPSRDLSNLSWKSFMTDDHTPIELSWDWGLTGASPAIRYSVEPIGPYAGSAIDRLNQYAGPQLLRRLRKSIPGMDLEWFEHLAKEFLVFDDSPNTESHQSRFFAAFDLHQGEIAVKAYFFPAFKAVQCGQPALAVISEALTTLPGFRFSNYGGFSSFKSFMEERNLYEPMKVEMLAIDCTTSASPRLKIYARSGSTSFDSVRQIMTLGAKLDSVETLQGLEELQTLWELLFGSDRASHEELSHVQHRTAGILYNFEFRPGSPFPVPKLYIPVRHYARNDSTVFAALQTYFQRCGHEYGMVDQFLQAMKAIR